MGSSAGVGVLPTDLALLKNCSKASSFRGGNTTISFSFPSRFGSDSKNYTILKSFPVASAASFSGSGGAQYSGSAILAPRAIEKVAKGHQPEEDNQTEEDASNSVNQGNPFIQFFKTLSKFTKFISDAVMRLVKGMVGMLNSLYKKFLLAILRSAFAAMLVRMVIDKFGVAGVKNAWYDSKQVTEHVIQGYTKPLRIKGWDKALLEYTAAMLTDTSSESKPPLSKRLREISCPVLIVTGDTDRIVPSWNAKRLSQAIPGSYLEVIKHCGHLPHEEKFHEFVSIVKKFLQTALGDSQEQHIQAVV